MQFFPHENLHVYAHAVGFARLAAELVDSWPSGTAVCSQLDRATESIIVNLARAARGRATERGIYHLECSLGSVLESAACLDVADRRHLLAAGPLQQAKQALQRIARMEVGRRHSWTRRVKEESGNCDAVTPVCSRTSRWRSIGDHSRCTNRWTGYGHTRARVTSGEWMSCPRV